MKQTFLVTFQQMLVMFLYMASGFALRKSKKVNIHLSESVSGLLVYLLSPAVCLNSFATNFKAENLSRYGTMLLIAIAVLMVLFALAAVLSKWIEKDSYKRIIYWYSFTIANYGFMGYPLIKAIYGEEMLFTFVLYCIPSGVLIYSWGLRALNPNAGPFKWYKLFNASIIAMIIGALIGLSGITLPHFISTAVSSLSSCQGPCAMLMAGFLLGGKPFFSMLKAPKMYLASLIRLIAIPALVCAALVLCGADHTLLTVAVLAVSMPLGLNTVVFPEAYGGDSTLGIQACIISTLMGVFTIPLVCSVLTLF